MRKYVDMFNYHQLHNEIFQCVFANNMQETLQLKMFLFPSLPNVQILIEILC